MSKSAVLSKPTPAALASANCLLLGKICKRVASVLQKSIMLLEKHEGVINSNSEHKLAPNDENNNVGVVVATNIRNHNPRQSSASPSQLTSLTQEMADIHKDAIAAFMVARYLSEANVPSTNDIQTYTLHNETVASITSQSSSALTPTGRLAEEELIKYVRENL